MRCDCDVMPRQVQGQGRSRLSQGMYFYKTRRLVWSGLLSRCSRCSEALQSQCRSVVGRLAVKIRVSLAEKRGGCVVGDAGPWMRDWPA